MKELVPFSAFLLAHHLETIASIHLAKAKEVRYTLPRNLTHLSDDQIIAVLKDIYQDLLTALAQGKGDACLLASITKWHQADWEVNTEQIELNGLMHTINLCRHSFTRLIEAYTPDLHRGLAIMEELNELCDYSREKIVKAHTEAQSVASRRERDLLNTILDTTTHGIYSLDQDMKVTMWNKTLAQQYGIKKTDIEGKRITEVFPELQTNQTFEVIKKVQKGEAPQQKNIPVQYENKYFVIDIVPLKDHISSTIGSLTITKDVTELQQMINKLHMANNELSAANEEMAVHQEEMRAIVAVFEQKIQELEATRKALVESQQFVESIARTSPDLITVYNLKERKNIYANRDLSAFLNINIEEIRKLGANFFQQLMHPDDISTFTDFLINYRKYTGDAVREIEYRVKDKNGAYLWVLGRYNVFSKDQDGFPLEIICISQDITARKKSEMAIHEVNQELAATLEEIQIAEEQLHEANDELEKRIVLRTQDLAASEEQLRMITDALPVLISYFNTKQEFQFVNRAYSTWFRKPKTEILGKRIWKVIGKPAYQILEEAIQKTLAGKEMRFEGAIPYKFDGIRNTIVNFIPHQVNNEVVGFFGLVTDVSSIKKTQNELVKKNEELVRINYDLDNFIYTASHDLKSPIANLEGLIRIVTQTYVDRLDEKDHQLLGMMEKSVSKLSSTIHYLTDITKVAKNLDQKAEVISIPEVIEEAKSDIEHLIRDSSPIFEQTLEVSKMNIARAKFKSIAYNLISNAIKYRSRHAPLVIKIKTCVEDNYIVFSVQDNGLGIPEYQHKKLFTMFKRLHTHVEGTGIGLYIVKRTIENLGGRISVESKLNEGSTFYCYLPK